MSEFSYAESRQSSIPEWSRVQLHDVASINSESLGAGTSPDYTFRYIDISSVNAGTVDWSAVQETQYRAAPSRARRIVRPADLLLCTVRPALQAHAYASWTEPEGYICSTGFAVVRSESRLHARFLYHQVFSSEVGEQIRRREIGSSYPAITERDVRSLVVPLPPLPEQRRIAEVLDTADEAIRQTEALIAKLKLMKQGLLHDLLTRGLDENGELRDPVAHPEQFKDSPLGRIPRGWEVVPLQATSAEASRSFTDGDWIESPWITDHGIRLVQTGNIGKGEFLDKPGSHRFISPRTFRQLGCTWVHPGDILICRLADPIGRACIVPEDVGDCVTAVDCTIYRPNATVVRRKYVVEYLNSPSQLQRILDSAGGSTRQRISRGHLGASVVLVPQLSEQARIETVLHAHNTRIRSEETYRDKLRLLKQGLMQDLLTGRVRVPVPEHEPELAEAGA